MKPTHQNDPLPAAVGCKEFEIIQRDALVQQARDRGAQLREGLLRLKNNTGVLANSVVVVSSKALPWEPQSLERHLIVGYRVRLCLPPVHSGYSE